MKRILGLVLLIAAFSAGAFAQANAGLAGISGTVHDGTGAVIPGAMVTVTNETRGIERTTLSTEAGVFVVPALVPAGAYNLKVSLQGFKTWEAKNFDLQVGQTVDFRVTLDVAGAAAEVSVTAEAPLVDENKSGVSQVVDQTQIDSLPINGRRVDSFVLLTPGVTNDGNFGLLTFRGIANGNSFLLDGNDSTERFFMENNGRTRVVSQISQDAVQEFQVVSADFSAEYGRASGGVVNTVTRSGSNALHGTAYSFYRDNSFNAHDPYAPVDSTGNIINPPDERYQSGGSLGGPFIKDKLFYFVNGEYTHRNFPIADNLIKAGVVDTTNQVWVGCGTTAGGTVPTLPTAAQCASINSVLPRFFGQVPRTMGQPLAFGRLDYHYSDRNTFSASFNYMHFRAHNGLQNTLISSTSGAGINANGNDYGQVRNTKFSWTSVPNARLVNEFRYGWSTDLEGDDPNPALLSPVLGYLDASVGGVQLGTTNYLPRVEPNEHRHELADNATWSMGQHVIKFGADFTTADDYALFLQNLHGSYTYQSVNAFALDFSGNTTGAKNWQSYSQTLGSGTTDMRINNISLYGQDQWRITPKLTANIGLRYEYEPLPQPSQSSCNPDYPQTCRINRSTTNFMPRLGLSYRLNDKTVVRAGYGMYYASIPGATLMNLFLGNGIVQQSVSLSSTQATQLAQGPIFPNNLGTVPAGFKVGPPNIQFASPNWKSPYSEQGTLAIERQLTRDIVLTTSYIWSRGIHLYGETDLNLPPLSPLTYTYQIGDASGKPTGATFTTPMYLGTRPNPNYGSVVQADNGVGSYYNGLAVQLQKRFSRGLQGNVSYTWSHEIDDGQGFGQATQNIFLSNAFAWTYNGNYRYDMGDGLEDQRQRLAINWVWAPTFTERTNPISKFLVNNWQLSSLTTINSSRPYSAATIRVLDTPVKAGTLGPGVAGMFSNFSINGSGLGGRVPFFPMDSVYQPALYKTDARISKVLPFGNDGQYKLFLNFEVFNVTNSWSPTSMSSQAYTETGGILTLTPTAYNQGTGDSAPPDGTLARRMQVSIRFQF
jgi:hypothetical protein